MQRLVAQAQRIGGPAVVFTFDPHPAQILRPERAPTPLGWTERNAELLGQLGVDAVIAFPTDQDFLQLDARTFFERIVCDRLGARAMVEGPNFFFGHNRGGTIDVLRQYCDAEAIVLEVVAPIEIDGQLVSSSRIRKLVAAGEVAAAAELLGRPYRIQGTVVRGAGRGNTLGFPTANLEHITTVMPSEGIYACRAWVDGCPWPAATSLGPNPTFDEDSLKVEPYLLGYNGSLYGHRLELDFLARLRDIVRFDDAEALRVQIDRDVADTQTVFEQHQNIGD